MSKNKDFDVIMRTITARLTGDAEADIKYLDEQSKKYKTHPLGKEIIRACGRLIAKLLPEDEMKEFARFFDNEKKGITAVIEEAQFNLFQKNYDKALELMESLVHNVEEQGFFIDDEVNEYHCFNELFEEALFMDLFKPEKELRIAEIPYPEIYLYYGMALIDNGRIEDAIVAFKKGMKWNPIYFNLNSEYREALKMSGRIDEFFDETIKAFTIAFKSKDLAKCYRDLGYYFIEKKKYPEAMGCYGISTAYDKEAKQAMSEMYYIHSETDGKVRPPSDDELSVFAKKYGFPIGPDDNIVSLAVGYGKLYLDKQMYDGARYAFEIVYELTEDKYIKKEICPYNGVN